MLQVYREAFEERLGFTVESLKDPEEKPRFIVNGESGELMISIVDRQTQ